MLICFVTVITPMYIPLFYVVYNNNCCIYILVLYKGDTNSQPKNHYVTIIIHTNFHHYMFVYMKYIEKRPFSLFY
jgi:hypothetical protein